MSSYPTPRGETIQRGPDVKVAGGGGSTASSSGSGSGAAAADLGDMPEWDMSALYPSPNAREFKSDLDKVGADAKRFREDYEGRVEALARELDGLAEPIRRYEALRDLAGRIGSYAGLLYAGDTSDPERAKLYGDVEERLTSASTELLFFTLALNEIEDDVLAEAMSHPGVGAYRPWLEDLRKDKPYQLDEKLERLFHETSLTGYSAWTRLFNETMTGLRFRVDGEELALEPALNLLSDANGEKRKGAATALADVFQDNVRLFTLVTNTLAKNKEISDRWRGFDDVAASRHLANRVEPEVVDALVAAVRGRYANTSHRYYAMKAKWLGRPDLAHWDRNAPLPDEPDRRIVWPQARQTVLDAYRAFSPRMAAIAEEFFDRNWIDAPVRPGKSPGAFSHPTVPSAHPFILLNYLGKPRDVMTLAHELGHGVHQVLANEQGALMAPTPLTLAETASVFGEMLTFKALLAETSDQQQRKALIASKVEDMINTVVRQIAFYVFERKVHTARREGELTAEQLGAMWLEVQAESLGPAVSLKPGYETFWCYIPHFIHSPFYVYAYAFGECLVNSLFAVYEASADGFAERYLDMLRAGGTRHHSDLLAPFGLDAREPSFWEKGLSVIERLIDELELMEA